MGNSEEAKSSKAEKLSSPNATDQANHSSQTNIHVYPDWGAMQAYYGPRVTFPPYYNSAMASGHTPHPYMWGPPQHMISAYGAPYAAIYSHGGVYAHPPTVPVGPHPHGHGHPSSPAVAAPHSIENPSKSSGNTDRGLVKKLKGFDALVMTIGNGNVESDGGAEHRVSQSSDTGASSDGSDGHTSRANRPRRKRSHEATPSTDGNGESSSVSEKEVATSIKAMKTAAVPGKPVLSPGMTTALELQNASTIHARTNPSSVGQSCAIVTPDAQLQNERELKRERRKQSNRESARRSRLRKQAETEDLSRKVECLTSENVTLKFEISRLNESSEKIRAENAALMEKVNNEQPGHVRDMVLNSLDKRDTPRSTENLLSRVNNATSNDRTANEDGRAYDKKSNSGAKLHQLLETSPRVDAVAAG